MSLPHLHRLGLCAATTAILTVSVASAAVSGASEQTLIAPFTCGSEWSGTTYAGHGLNEWNLDLNQTSLVWPDTDHDRDQPVLAQANGTVVWLERDGYNNGAGAYAEIDYGDITVRYIHLADYSMPADIAVIGATVQTGELIGLVGDTGNASHPHLHLEYWNSADHDNAPRWQLPAANHIQITMAGVVIEPRDRFVSKNCDGPTPESYPFADVAPASFAYDDIALLAALGLTTGTSPTTFDPHLDVTREQMAAFLARLWLLVDAGATELAEPLPQPFTDVEPDSFAHDDIALLAHLEITTGTSPTTFDPHLDVTREQMAAFLARLWLLVDAGATELAEPLPQPFTDVEPDSFAHDDIALLAHLEITTGTTSTTYDPDDTVTREQMAAFLARLWLLLTSSSDE